jgi:hypothetical protein
VLDNGVDELPNADDGEEKRGGGDARKLLYEEVRGTEYDGGGEITVISRRDIVDRWSSA